MVNDPPEAGRVRAADNEPRFPFVCPHCGHLLRIRMHHEGRAGRCKHCGQEFVPTRASAAPAPDQTAPDPPPAEPAASRPAAPSRLTRLIEPGLEPPRELLDELDALLLEPGDVVAGRFEVVELIGFGPSGCVYDVADREHDGAHKALKAMAPSLVATHTARERFRAGIEAVQRLKHDGIVKVNEAGQDEERGFEYFTMEHVSGQPLRRFLSERGGPLPPREAVDIACRVCEALEHAHEHTVHGNLKPENVLVQADGAVKVLDFGLAALMTTGHLAKSSEAFGTTGYRAPEQSVHLQEPDERADLYSLGALLYLMLTGEPPGRPRQAPSRLADGVPKGLDAAVMACLEPEPARRPASARALRHALNRAVTARRDLSLVIAAVGLVVIALAWATSHYIARESEPPAPRNAPLRPSTPAPRPVTPDPAASVAPRLPVKPAAPPPAAAQFAPGQVQIFAGIEFVWIPPGTFDMGSPADEPEREDDETLHTVAINRGFWLGRYEVSQAEWAAVMGAVPAKFTGDDLPVETVSWDDCDAYLRRLNEAHDERFRLPTEAEWEYACRAGTGTAFHFGPIPSTDEANYDGSFVYPGGAPGLQRNATLPVGSFAPNAWGLFDMHGNVAEWCQDWYDPYPDTPVADRFGPDRGTKRVFRGGSWYNAPALCRSANRDASDPALRSRTHGLRLCKDP
ncbi:MAG: SUMF1/EgtB/PvdO family nonheme iron enzyme [Candidatus Hydrogenedentes bacterium]|nr:SUMF1/EgtB/PvdO family nonheme iron enzyme [Candidatus Hydrogenedentota bacterium]